MFNLDSYTIEAWYQDFNGQHIKLGRYKTEDKAWKALDTELSRLMVESCLTEECINHFNDHCYVLFSQDDT